MADITPKDLQLTPQPDTDKNYFNFKAVGLKPGQQYSIKFQWIYQDGTLSDWSPGYKITTAGYVTKLVKPSVTVSAASLGYTVSYTKQTDSNFAYAIIEEVVSNSSTAPTSGWVERTVTSSNPITITVGDTDKRWVRIKLTDKISGETPYSDPVAVTPVDPVAAALDITPPTAASSVTAVWSGNNILITATVSEDAKKFIIKLTNGSNNGYFTKFPSTAGTAQSILITQTELYNTFGQYYTSFTGLFISADSFDNRDSGTSFTVGAKTNPLLGVVPTFTLTGITNGYTATWTLPAGASYAKVYESGTTWGAGNPSESDLVFSGSSPAIIKKTVYTQRYVKIKFLTDDDFESSWSSEQTVTPVDSISADTNAPASPSTITGTAGIDDTGSIGFNGYLNLSWPAVSDSTLRGYRIRFRPVTTPASSYSYVDSPGTGTAYRLGGLAVGTTYEIGIASYDEFNNTSSSYTAVSPNLTVSGTPFIGTNVTTTGYFGASSTGDTGMFKFGYGVETGKRGLVFNANNYWYIDSSESALFKIGGASSNYVSWNGTKLSIDGDLGVAGGTTIGGNISMGASGASIYQGTLNGSGNLTSNGFLLNSNGLVIKKNSVELRLDTSDGGIYADYGRIAGWTLDSAKFEKLVSSSYTGMSTGGSYSFYAGSPTSGGASTAEFYVTPDGLMKANNVNITGGTLQVGATSIAASTGKLITTDAEVTGKITANSGSITGNLDITGTLYIGASATSGDRILLNSGGIAAYANGVTAPRFELAKDGTGKIGGWTVNATSLSASGMTLNAADQTISFKQGFIMDNDSISVPVVGATSNSGSSSTESDTPDSYYSTLSSGSSSSTSSTFAIKLPTANFTNSPKISLTSDSSSGASVLLSNYGNSLLSYIQLANGGIVMSVGRTGAVAMPGFTNRVHYSYSYNESPQMLMIKSDGTLSTGRSIFKSGATETNIVTNGTHNHVGLIGDLIFSTAD
jgi:hypothetical protein